MKSLSIYIKDTSNWAVIALVLYFFFLILSITLVTYMDDLAVARLLAKAPVTICVIVVLMMERTIVSSLFRNHWLSVSTLAITTALVVTGVGSMKESWSAGNYDIIEHIGRNIMTAVFEEGLIRLMLFTALIIKFQHSKNRFWKTTILSSFFFAIAHFSAALSPHFGLTYAISQVIFAFGVGILLQVSLARSHNILVPICLHFIINFFGNMNDYNPDFVRPTVDGSQSFLLPLLNLGLVNVVLIIIALAIYTKGSAQLFVEKCLATIKKNRMMGIKSL